MTHLSDLNNEEFSIGDQVHAGDVVGYCGNSGNASTTAPHVHFGWYAEGGVDVRNPMKYLIQWLHQAERRVLGVVTKTTEKRVRDRDRLTLERRFGDAFAPDRSVLSFSSEGLWASGSSPSSGTFALAESALQAALSSNGLQLGIVPAPIDLLVTEPEAGGNLDPDSALAQLLAGESTGPEEGSD
jgi:hypothetical protein